MFCFPQNIYILASILGNLVSSSRTMHGLPARREAEKASSLVVSNSSASESPRVFIYLFKRFIQETQRGRDLGRGRSRLPARSSIWDQIPGPRDHNLSRRQTLNQ